MIAAIVCVDENNGIGYKGNLLVHIKEDMKMFSKITGKGSVIMGRKTWDSLNHKPLKNRTNIVITHKNKKLPKVQPDGTVSANMKAIKAWLLKDDVIRENNGIYVIGGAQIYKELLPFCERVYITKVFQKYDADVFFPDITQMPEWELTSSSEIQKTENGVAYQFCIYDRCDYEITSIQTPENSESKWGEDMVITVKTFNGYKSIILSVNKDNHITVYSDDWEYLFTKENLNKFVERALEYNRNRKDDVE